MAETTKDLVQDTEAEEAEGGTEGTDMCKPLMQGKHQSGLPLTFRKPGAPAGSHPGQPWHVCVFHDPYERINFWSHFVPGVCFVVLGIIAYLNLTLGGRVLSMFCAASSTTHLLSAVTHVWPDNHLLEKLDHIGIVALIVGTPLTALLAKDPADDMKVMGLTGLALVGAAFLRPTIRTLSFVALGTILFVRYWTIVNVNLTLQVVLYLMGAYSFIQVGGLLHSLCTVCA
ncbi:hypothetical protein DUNSADRAFT_7288 [Dunaliella salina]|uniref:Uncharacterized protein n=1 Tax=Dunaliella salina TaxID=3046 RepID=A0ABQ7GLL1_DUNSA|nr:hypothetical protein DUNSADRAFT_7288 [Dunaliella salina]|eukprot:KAF5835504.1 hypothetical protein DUNSADRAFT_7288 [Dunaliella salina]